MFFPGEMTGVIEKKLDSCVVSVYPALNPDHETLTVPHNMITQFGITAKLSKDGATLTGSNVIYNYQQVRCPTIYVYLHVRAWAVVEALEQNITT